MFKDSIDTKTTSLYLCFCIQCHIYTVVQHTAQGYTEPKNLSITSTCSVIVVKFVSVHLFSLFTTQTQKPLVCLYLKMIHCYIDMHFTYIFMFEKAQHLQLPKYPLARNKILEDIGHLFKSNPLSISRVCH